MSWEDRRDGTDEDLEAALIDKFAARHIHHLYDIIHEEKRSLDQYYAEDSESFGNKSRIAEQIEPRYESTVTQLLRLQTTQFRSSQINRTALADFLAEYGVSFDVMEDMTYKDYILTLYHVFYDPDETVIPEPTLKTIIAETTLYKTRNDRSYRHEHIEVDLDRIEDRVDDFLRRYNRRNNRRFDIRVYDASESVVLKFFQERTWTARYVFEDRTDDADASHDHPSVTSEPQYPVKTITVRVENLDQAVEIKLSESKDGWKTEVEDVLHELTPLSNALGDEHRKRAESVDALIGSARDTAKEDETENDDIEEDIHETLGELRERAIEEQADQEDTDVEVLRERYETIEPVGLQVEDGTITKEFDIESKATLGAMATNEPGISTSIEHFLADDDYDVGLRFRIFLPERRRHETFVLKDGTVHPDGGLSTETGELLDTLFDDHDRTHG